MDAEIITIGDEILIGQVIDTNSAWMARKLNEEGIDVIQISSISDDPLHIEETLSSAAKRVRLVLITGGLGPTGDDRTRTAVCRFFNTRLAENPLVLNNILELWGRRGITINSLNRDQALVPESAAVFVNKMGTAPGLLLEKQECSYVFMPGVPFEMKYLMEQEVIPWIRKNFSTSPIIHHTFQTFGLAESMLAERISAWESSLPKELKLAYLPSPESNRLRLTARGDDRAKIQKMVNEKASELYTIIPEFIFGEEEDTLTGVTGKLLKKSGLTVSTAESCTGGYIAHLITSVSGSSEYFKGSVTAYANKVKTEILGVDGRLIEQHGAVSREVVEEMAVKARKLLKTDYTLATSGTAGPTGGTDEKPVGMVWIAVAGPEKVISKVYNFGNDRGRTIIRSSQTALNMLRLILNERMKLQ
jgi:nicotinamide-nucleotide amidase